MARRLGIVLGSLVLLFLVLAGGLLAWAVWLPDTLKPPLERYLSARLDRPVSLQGPLRIDPGRITTLEIADARIGAPEWAEAEALAAVERLRVGVDVGAYLRDGAIRLTELEMRAPAVALERDAQGRTTWPQPEPEAGGSPAEPPGRMALPRIDRLAIADGRVAYRDAMTGVEAEAAIATTPADAAGPQRLVVDGQGSVRGDPLQVALEVGTEALRTGGQAALPISGELSLPGTRAQVSGEIREPADLTGVSIAFDLRSENPRPLLAMAGVTLDSPLPPLAASGTLARPEAESPLELRPLQASWGDSRLEGWLSLDPRPERPRIAGELTAPRLELEPLWPLLTADTGAPPSDTPLAFLAPFDGQVSVRAGEIGLPGLRLTEARADLLLDATGLAVNELRVGLPAGEIAGQAKTGPLDQQLAVELAVDAREVDLARVTTRELGLGGTVEGRVEGTVRGTDPATILAQSRLGLELRGAGLASPYGRANEVELTGRLADGTLAVEPLRVELPEGRIAGRLVAAELDQTPRVEGDLTVEGMQLASVMGEDSGYAGLIEGRLTGAGPVSSLAAALNEARLQFEGRAEGLKVPQLEVGTVATQARLEDGRLTLAPFAADLPEGRIAGQVVAGPFGEGFTADVNLDVDEVDLGAMAATEGVGGVLTGKVEGTLRGSSAVEILTRSDLQLDGKVDELSLPQLAQRVPAATITARLDPEAEQPLQVDAEGRFGEAPLRLTVRGGDPEALAANRGDYPVTAEAQLGESAAALDGKLVLPLTERRFQASVRVEGPDPAPVLALLELPELELPPYRIAANVSGEATRFEIADLDGRVGDSDVGGDLVVQLDGPRPKLSGELRSSRLDVNDFGGLIGAQPATGPGETASAEQEAEAAQEAADGEVIPDEPLQPSRWRKVDLDLELAAEDVAAGPIPFDAFEADVVLEDGHLRIQPMILRLGEGRVEGQVELDAGESPVEARVEADLQRLPVARLLNQLDVDVAAFGTLSGTARGGVGVGGYGLSLKQILSNADGEVTLVVQGGAVDRTLVSAMGFDLLRLFGSFLGAAPEQVELRCTLADLAIRDGIVDTRSLVMDTSIADVGGDGTINLETEAIDIELLADPEGAVSGSGRTGISIGGTLAEPEIEVDAGLVAARGAAALAFGVLLRPFTALASTIAGADEDQESPCAGVLAQQAQD